MDSKINLENESVIRLLIIKQLLTKKKSAMWEFETSFTWGKNEAYSPEDNILNSFEKLLQRGRGRVIMYVILEKGEYMQSSTHFFVKSFF